MRNPPYRTPKNKFPRATGLPDMTYHFKGTKISERDATSRKRSFWGRHFEKAYNNPGVTQKWYIEENGYEHETRYTWYPETKTMVTNTYECPNVTGHHLGSICGICRQEG